LEASPLFFKLKRFSKTFKKSRIYYLLLFNFELFWQNVLKGGFWRGEKSQEGLRVQAGQVELSLRGKMFQRDVLKIKQNLEFFEKISC
jgi:hypothetical protein